MRLLLIEDDGMVGESVRTGLRREGFTVDWVKDEVAAELAAANDDYALILLDLGLPRKDGIDVLKALRRKGGHVPIPILTARDAVPDRVLGLSGKAQWYRRADGAV
jgi:two-component system, OmpR family, response regulator QseB